MNRQEEQQNEDKRQKAFQAVLNYFAKHLPGPKYRHLNRRIQQAEYAAWVRCEPDEQAERQSEGYIDVSVIMLARQHNRTGLRLWVRGDKKRKAIIASKLKERLSNVSELTVECSVNRGNNPNAGHALYDFYRGTVDWRRGLSPDQIETLLNDYLRIEDDLKKNGFWN